MEPRFLTPSEVAAELRVSSDTVLRLIAAGELPALRVSARIYRIPRPAFEAFRAGRVAARRAVIRRRVDREPDFGAKERASAPARP